MTENNKSLLFLTNHYGGVLLEEIYDFIFGDRFGSGDFDNFIQLGEGKSSIDCRHLDDSGLNPIATITFDFNEMECSITNTETGESKEIDLKSITQED